MAWLAERLSPRRIAAAVTLLWAVKVFQPDCVAVSAGSVGAVVGSGAGAGPATGCGRSGVSGCPGVPVTVMAKTPLRVAPLVDVYGTVKLAAPGVLPAVTVYVQPVRVADASLVRLVASPQVTVYGLFSVMWSEAFIRRVWPVRTVRPVGAVKTRLLSEPTVRAIVPLWVCPPSDI